MAKVVPVSFPVRDVAVHRRGENIDIPDAQWRFSVLEDEIKRIEDQLADPRRKTDRASGRQLSEVDYTGWRAKADDAMYHKKRELGYLNAWLERKGAPRVDMRDELVLAVEETVPILTNLGGSISESPVVKRLFEVFGMITGAFKRE